MVCFRNIFSVGSLVVLLQRQVRVIVLSAVNNAGLEGGVEFSVGNGGGGGVEGLHGVDHEVEAQRHDMRTDHAAFLIHSAGTVRNDRTVVQHLHLHGHGPAVGQSNLARDHMVEIVPVRLHDASALRNGHGLPEAGVTSPVDQGLEGKVGRRHS